MNDTTHVTGRLQAYLDGEVTGAERETIDRHLDRCESCRAELSALRGLWQAVDAAAEPAPASPIWPAVDDALARRRGRIQGPPWTWPQRGLAAASLAAGLVLGVGLSTLPERGASGADGTVNVIETDDYLQDGLPTLDDLWLEVGAANEDAES
ncbi:hypothetical protein GF314_05870 [bacterium]|nr:hypothetical protein [bacterium]